MKLKQILNLSLILVFNFTAAQAHINLLKPKALLTGQEGGRAQKYGPFGAGDVDIASAKAIEYKSGSYIEIEVEAYIVHAGYITVSYTQDFEGKDMEAVMVIPSANTQIPQKNMLAKFPAPCPEDNCKARKVTGNIVKTMIRLPDIEGEIILVVRQIMTDNTETLGDGSVDISRVYYHQGAKLKLVK